MNIYVTGLGCIVFGLIIDKFCIFFFFGGFVIWSVEDESMGLCDLLLAYHALMKMAWLWFVILWFFMWSLEFFFFLICFFILGLGLGPLDWALSEDGWTGPMVRVWGSNKKPIY